MTPVQAYIDALLAMVKARTEAGGVLMDEDVIPYIESLDRLWWTMTVEEQNECERVWTDLQSQKQKNGPRFQGP